MTHDSILTNPTESQRAEAVEENLYALFRAMASSLGGDLDERAGLVRHHAFPTNPMFKGVWGTRLSPDEADDAIHDTIAWFKDRNAPFFFWWTGHRTTPDDLGERLVAHGLLSMEAQMQDMAPGMVADLQRMNEAALAQVPPGFAIEEVRDEAALSDFKRVLVEGYEIPEPMADGWVQAARHTGIGRSPWRMYLGRLNGQPVATNMLFNGGGVASVYGVATVPSARGQGIGGAITLKPLIEARDTGYRHAVLFSTEMGVRVYERIGFRLTDARINRFLWRKE